MKGIRFDGSITEVAAKTEKRDAYLCVSVPADYDFSSIERIEVDPFGAVADCADDGYLVLPRGDGCNDYALCLFRRHKRGFVRDIRECNMPVFGVKAKDRCFLAVVSGMSYDYTLRIVLENASYRIFPVFEVNGEQPYEDFKVEYFELCGEDANYSGMARRYRQYKVDKDGLRPLAERMRDSDTLAYSVDSVMIRIRCGWKPAPAAVRHQTAENEPAMHVACDFDRVGDILDELKRQGVEKAEICLVGWNVKGHDGRWPQAFPVCEELGGEEKLRRLISKAQAMGYQMTCHTNSTDQYEIADCFDPEHTRRNRYGNPVTDPAVWSGGEMYQLCPKIGYTQAEEILPKVAVLGFRGTHYVDVLGVVHPRRCWHKSHPVNSQEAVAYAAKIAGLAKELFGGFSSEGAFDFITPYLDYGLYISFTPEEDELCDKRIPFWQLVYHGYVLSNPYSTTVNPTFKDKRTQLKLIEYGGRPSYYFYSAFMGNGANWMGAADAVCGTDDQLLDSVHKIKQGYDAYQNLCDLHTAFMEKHEEVSENIFETTYSNGTVVRVDYNRETCTVLRREEREHADR